YGEMVTSSASANTQRRRWEEGRKQLVRENARRLFGAALAESDRVRLDLALDLVIPPLSTILMALVVLQLLATALVIALRAPGYAQAGFGLGIAAVVLYVLRGWMVSGTGLRGLLDLALAPFYVG